MKRFPASRRARAQSGVTLFELLIVLVIIGLLATLVAPRVIGYLGRSKSDVARAQLSSIATSLELFYLDLGRYPSEAEGLAALVEPPEEDGEAWQGPYLRNQTGLTDPWGEAYLYRLSDEGPAQFTVLTYGRDAEEGGDGEDRDILQQ